MQETAHSSRGDFVEERQILDSILVANEVVDEKRHSGEEGIVFKIDFEKAYNHVKCDFLDHVLEWKGFGWRWKSWICGCISSIDFVVLISRMG